MTPDPLFGIHLSELSEWEKENLCWSEVQDLQRRIRARGIVVRQAPASDPVVKYSRYIQDAIHYARTIRDGWGAEE